MHRVFFGGSQTGYQFDNPPSDYDLGQLTLCLEAPEADLLAGLLGSLNKEPC